MLRLPFGSNANILTDSATTGDCSTDAAGTSLPVPQSRPEVRPDAARPHLDPEDASESFPQSLQSEGSNPQAIRDRAPINIADALTDPRNPEAGRATARARGYRSQVVVPLLRNDAAIGTIAVSRREPGGFADGPRRRRWKARGWV